MHLSIHKQNTLPSGSGSALLMVLWAVAMMSMTVLGVVEYVHYDLEETTGLERTLRVRQLAEAGVAIGLHPAVKRLDSVLTQVIGPGESFEVHLRSEGSRLNINTVVAGNEWQILHDLFVIWGLKQSDAVIVADSFQKWTAADKWRQLISGQSVQNGQSQRVVGGPPAQQLPPHQFQSVAEMLMIPGMDLVEGAKPDWQNYFTIWSDGPLDMNEAPADLIMAVCGVGSAQAQNFVNARLGPDGIPDTQDDVIFQDMQQVQQLLRMSNEAFALIQGRLSLQDSATRVESTGILGNYRRKTMVVAKRTVNPVVYYLWQEE